MDRHKKYPTSCLSAFLLKKALQDSQVMASKLCAKALSPHTRHIFSSSLGRLRCFLRGCGVWSSWGKHLSSSAEPCWGTGATPITLFKSVTMARATASRSADLSGSGSESGSSFGCTLPKPLVPGTWWCSLMFGERSRGVESGDGVSENNQQTHWFYF